MFHLVLDASLEVAQKGFRLFVLKLSILYWASTKMVIQLHHEDGGSPPLILGSFLACGITDGSFKIKEN